MMRTSHTSLPISKLWILPLTILLTLILAATAFAAPLDPSGDLDSAFDSDGKKSVNFANVLSFAEGRAVGIQSTGKIVIGGSSVEGGFINHFALIRLNADGTQDMSFGNGGTTKLPTGSYDLINDLVIQPDNKIVAVGFASGGSSDDFAIARFTADGTPDTTFGGGLGYVLVDFGGVTGPLDRAESVVIQDDGKIVVAGMRRDDSSRGDDVALVRLNADGTLDTTFGIGGKVITPVAVDKGKDEASAVVIIGTGVNRKILIGGSTRNEQKWDAATSTLLTHIDPKLLLVRYNNNGTLDTTFGSGGIKINKVKGDTNPGCPWPTFSWIRIPGYPPIPYPQDYGCGEAIEDIALQPDGKIVATGSYVNWGGDASSSSTKTHMLTARFNADGSFDTSFDEEGDPDGDDATEKGYVITTAASGHKTDVGKSIAVQADGKIVTFGWTDQSSGGQYDHDFLFVRFNSNGSYDNSFDGNGSAIIELGQDGNTYDDGDAMVIDSTGKIIGVGMRTSATTSDSFIGVSRLTTTGAPDNTFGPDVNPVNGQPDGYFYTQLIGGSRDDVGGMTVQSDGKPVLVGFTDNGNNFDFGIARFNTNGSLDTTFSGDGLLNVGVGTQHDTARAVAIQSDGKIVVAGDSYGTGTPHFTVMRFNTGGTLDTTFDGDGIATTTFGGNGNQPYAVAIQSDGKILVGGSVSDLASNWDYGLARFNSNGSLDTTFDTDGKVRVDLTTGGQSFDEIHAIAIQPDGKIVVGGRSSTSSNFYFSLARFNTNGSLDTTFDTDGKLTVRISHSANQFAGDEINGLLILPDGKIVAGGKALNNPLDNPQQSGLNAFALARFNPNGSLDTTFDTDGKILVNLGSNNQDQINGIALQFDEKVVAFGSSFSFATSANDFGLARFNWDDGSLDTTFGTNGVVTTNFTGFDSADAGTVISGGKMVAAGTDGSSDFAVARYLGDPAPTIPSAPDLVAASDSGVSNSDNKTNDNTPTFSGTCVTGETVILKVGGSDTTPRVRVRCINGAYSLTTPTTIADGTYSFTVVAVNGAGTSSASVALSVLIDTVAPTATPSQSPAANVRGWNKADVTVTWNWSDGSGSGTSNCAVSNTSSGEGTLTVSSTCSDVAGNSNSASRTVKVDKTKPTISGSRSPAANANGWNNANVTVSFTCADNAGGSGILSNNVAGATVSTDGANQSVTNTGSCVDNADNSADAATVSNINIDKSAPNSTIDSKPLNNSATVTASFGFSGSDVLSGVASYECKLDSAAFASCTSPKSYTGLAQGSHTFQVRAIDKAGNTDATPASFTWTVDTVAPDTTINSNPAHPTNSTSASFTFSGSDGTGSGVTSYQCKLDTGAFAACTSPKSYTSLAQGSHTFQVRAVDAAGNTDASPASFTWTVDTTAPDTTINSNPATLTNSNAASFGFIGSDSASTIASYSCSLDSGAFASCTSPQSYSGLTSGSHTFRVRATDAAGNTDGSPASFTWTVDLNGPGVTINKAASQADPGTGTINFTVVFTEAVSGFTNSDVTLSGTAGATTAVVSQIAPNDNTTFNVAVSGMTQDGTVIASLAANVANDAAGNGNKASTSTDNNVAFILNRAPVAGDSSTTATEDTALDISVASLLSNDSDPDGDSLTVTGVSAPAHGSAVLNNNSTPANAADDFVRYTPTANYNGSDTFNYTISDGRGGTDTGALNLTVSAVNDAPTVTNDTASTVEDIAVTIIVLTNDNDSLDGGTLNAASVFVTTPPASGTTSVNTTNGRITYTPAANFSGSASFVYQVCDNGIPTPALCRSATVNITISSDLDGDGIPNSTDPDDDNDNVPDGSDDFPLDASESKDTDGDGVGDNADTDDDDDNVLDGNDAFPLNPNESVDTDNDGIGNNADTDDDGDGVNDTSDAFPLDENESVDTDGDGTGNNADTDDDGDGVADGDDAFPLNPSESVDTDGDGTGDNADTDDDGDGVADGSDAFPLDENESVDTDGDGTGNNADSDDDEDGVADGSDAFPLDPSESVDTDSDGTGNNADTDDDGDGVADEDDAFPLDKNESVDTDSDGTGNNADTDDDGDGVADDSDAFPLDQSESVDTDGDGIGNNADGDDDGDGVADGNDAFPLDAGESLDTDGDGTGNNADTDDDGDGVADSDDDLPLDASDSVDTDGDGIGNTTDTDDDGDGVADDEDAFPLDKNESIDTDGDGTGNHADSDDDNDGVADGNDAFPLDPSESVDADGDGTGNNSDTDDDGDGVADGSDAFPLDKNESADTDSDGTGNNADTDDDNDGVADAQPDNCLLISNPDQADNDSDDLGDLCDADDDNDGVADNNDTFPFNPSESVDSDGDGTGNNADIDDDNDNVADEEDAFPLDPSESKDTDGDGIGNNADTDDDGDGVEDEADALTLDPSESVDTDHDGIGNNADSDDDGDGVADGNDAFPLNPNESVDTDKDGTGNNADSDDDGDGVADDEDALPLDPSESVDSDGDGIGNNADSDDDDDGALDEHDAFPLDPSESLDIDRDGIGNNTDTDDDGDGVEDGDDIFPLDPSESEDADKDGTGDNADNDDDNDGAIDNDDAFPLDPSENADTDEDGTGNNADTDDDNDGVADAQPDNCPLVVNPDQANNDGDALGDACDSSSAVFSDKVWFDENRNGIQEENEAGMAGVGVELYKVGEVAVASVLANIDGTLVATTTTNSAGEYLFNNLEQGDYYMIYTAPAGYGFTQYGIDSDAMSPQVLLSISNYEVQGAAEFDENLLYTIHYTNTDPSQVATNIIITAAVPAGTTFVAAGSDAGWSCTGVNAGSICTITIPALDAQSAGSLAFVVNLKGSESEVPKTLTLSVGLIHSPQIRTEIITLGEGEQNHSVKAGLVRPLVVTRQTPVPDGPTSLPGTPQPNQRRSLFLPTVQSQE